MARSSWGAVSGYQGYKSGPKWRLSGPGLRLELDGAGGDVGLAFQGQLQATIDAQLKELQQAYWRAMNRVVEAGKGRLRADVVAGGFHKAAALSKTWRGVVYPRDKNSLEVAGWLYTRAATIIDAFSTATVIKVSGNRKFLAIPQGPAKAIVRRLQAQKRKGLIGRNSFGRFEEDDSYVDQVASALGVDLQPIIAPDGQSGVLIAADNRTLTPTGRDAKRQNRAATVLFSLSKTATLKKRVQGRALLDDILRSFPDDFPAAIVAELPSDMKGR